MSQSGPSGRVKKYERAEWFERAIAAKFIEDAGNSGRRAGLIRGSSAGVTCKRRLAYAIFGYEPLPNDAANQWTLNVGNGLHDMIQMMMAKWGFVNAKPVINEGGDVAWLGDCEGDVLDKVHGIIGHYDGLTVPLKSQANQRFLLEFKTCTDRPKTIAVMLENFDGMAHTFKYVVGDGQSVFSPELERLEGSPGKLLTSRGNELYLEIAQQMGAVDADANPLVDKALIDVVVQPGKFTKLSAPSPEHVCQASYYAKTLGADRCLVIYLAKDPGKGWYAEDSIFNVPIKAYAFEPDLVSVAKFEQRCLEVWDYVERRELPPAEFVPGKAGAECLWCNYSHLCHPDVPDIKVKKARYIRELAMIGKDGLSELPWVTHSEEEQGRALIEKGIGDGHK